MTVEKLIIPKIAIIDDEHDIVEILSAFLKDDFPDIEKFTYTDVVVALKEIENKKINIILLDVNMPKIHGQNAFKQCMAFSHGCKVIMISGETSYTNVLTAFCDGASGFLYKPFKKSDVVEAVRINVKQITYWNEVLNRTLARKY